MVFASGAFDGLHAGHIAYLRAAALLAQDGELVVAVAPDSYIREVKGREPYWEQRDRADAVRGVKGVSRVSMQPHNTPAERIKILRPQVFVKGIDWARALPPDVVAACREVGCLIVYVDTEGTHTSEARR